MKALTNIGERNKLFAKEIHFLQYNPNKTECRIPPPSTDMIAIVVVVLPNAETTSNDIRLDWIGLDYHYTTTRA